MKKILSIFLLLAMLVQVTPIFAADTDSEISITLDKTTAQKGDYIEATIILENIAAEYIVVPVHFNPDVVKVADNDGNIVLSGVKKASQTRDGSIGLEPLQALSNDTDENGDAIYWNGAFFTNPAYPEINNEKGFYRLMFSNVKEKEIKSQTLVSIKFVVVGNGDTDIRFATKSDDVYDISAPLGARYTYANPDDAMGSSIGTEFDKVKTQKLSITDDSIKTPPPTQKPSTGGGGGGGGSTTVVKPTTTPNQTTLTYEITEKEVENLLPRAADETDNALKIEIDAESSITKFIIKMPVSAVQKALDAWVMSSEFETSIENIGFDHNDIMDNATENSQYVICTLTKDEKSVTIDGTPLKEKVSNDFDDLPPEHWAYEFVMLLAEKEIVSGMENNLFLPSSNVTREQFAKMLVEGLDLYDESAVCSFSDVDDDWYTPYIASAVNAGIISGYLDGNFGFGKNITREEMAVMVYRSKENFPITNEAITFTDSDNISYWAVDAVTIMQKAGIINGTPDGTFEPKNTATRAEAAKIICMMMGV